jgi:hypothetical protein
VIWVLTRDGTRLRCEVSRADAEGRYRIVLVKPGAPAVVEELAGPAAVIERTAAVMNQLRDEGWQLS